MGMSHVVVKKGVYNYSGGRGRFCECRIFRGGVYWEGGVDSGWVE